MTNHSAGRVHERALSHMKLSLVPPGKTNPLIDCTMILYSRLHETLYMERVGFHVVPAVMRSKHVTIKHGRIIRINNDIASFSCCVIQSLKEHRYFCCVLFLRHQIAGQTDTFTTGVGITVRSNSLLVARLRRVSRRMLVSICCCSTSHWSNCSSFSLPPSG